MATETAEDLANQAFADSFLNDRAVLQYVPAAPDPDETTGLPSSDPAPSPWALRGFWRGISASFSPSTKIRTGDVQIIVPHSAFKAQSMPDGPRVGDEIRLGDEETDRMVFIVEAVAVPSGVQSQAAWKIHGSAVKPTTG